jgi:hypothetical protein
MLRQRGEVNQNQLHRFWAGCIDSRRRRRNKPWEFWDFNRHSVCKGVGVAVWLGEVLLDDGAGEHLGLLFASR